MPNELSIIATAAETAPHVPVPAAAKPATTTTPAAATTTAAASSSSDDSSRFPSPVEHLDAALGIEVMQFIGQNGVVTESYPTQRQLDAYRDAAPAQHQATATGTPSSVA